MDFLKIFSRKSSNKEEVYAGLFLKETQGAVSFIQVAPSGNYHILANKKFKYSNGWENIVEDIDQAMYSLETHTKESPKKAIFFIYSHLIDKKAREIKAPYLEKIKKLAKNLDFVPLGYIEYHEAVVETINTKESTPLTAVLIEFDKTNLDIFIYRAGSLAYEESISRTDNLIEDLVPVFEKARIQMVIPSRMILYDSSDLAVESGRIMTHSWKENLFVQTPKVHVMHEGELIASLIKIFIAQIYSGKSATSEQKNPQPSHEEVSKKEVMGFVIGGDIPEKPVATTPLPHSPTQPTEVLHKKSLSKVPFLVTISQFKNKIRIPRVFKKKYTLIGGGIALLLGLLFIIEFFFHTAQVTVYFPAKVISKKISIDNLNLQISTQSANFDDTKNTTGKKDIGDYAKGSVTIYNSSLSESKNFSKGTIITGPNSLKFSLDADVKVASASGDASSVTSSTSKVTVTAKDFGAESNLPSGTKFSISGEPSSAVLAKNDSAFAGGSKRQVKTVSKQDIEDLKTSLISKAKDYNAKNIAPKLDRGTSLLNGLTEYNMGNTEFSHELGEEAERVNVKATVEITNYLYKNDDIRNKVGNSFNEDKTSNLVLRPDDISFNITKVEKTDKSYNLTLDARGKFTQNISEQELKTKMAGKNTKALDNLLKEQYKADKTEFVVHDPLPFMTNLLPLFKKNITIKILYH